MMKSSITKALRISAPEVFSNAKFVEWLNGDGRAATWHDGGVPNEYSDVMVLVDPSLNGEGSDSDMPDDVWDMIVDECRKAFSPSNGFHIVVWLCPV